MFREWLETCKALGIRLSPFYYLKLRRQYAEKQRYYHRWSHIENCFKVLNGKYTSDPNLPLVKMALFFHDVVYDPARKDNEDRSCEQFTKFALARIDLGSQKQRFMLFQVVNLIEITRAHKLDDNASRAQQIMNDVDMSILGADLGTYMAYAENVWNEYKGHGREAYTAGRIAFLRTIDPSTAFYTPEMKVLESRVRENVEAEISTLEVAPEILLR